MGGLNVPICYLLVTMLLCAFWNVGLAHSGAGYWFHRAVLLYGAQARLYSDHLLVGSVTEACGTDRTETSTLDNVSRRNYLLLLLHIER